MRADSYAVTMEIIEAIFDHKSEVEIGEKYKLNNDYC